VDVSDGAWLQEIALQLAELNEFLRANNLRVPLEPNGPQRPVVPSTGEGKTQQLPSGVSSGRTQSGNQPQRAAQTTDVRWASTKSGSPWTEWTDRTEVKLSKLSEKPAANGPRLVLSWQNNGRGYTYASLWDSKLFDFAKSLEGKKVELYTTKKGQWINVVGIRAL
jgi:hypothetical protein